MKYSRVLHGMETHAGIQQKTRQQAKTQDGYKPAQCQNKYDATLRVMNLG